MRKNSPVLKAIILASLFVCCLFKANAQTTSLNNAPLEFGAYSDSTVADYLEEIHQKFQVDVVYEADRLPKQKVNFNISAYNNAEAALEALLKPNKLVVKKLTAKSFAVTTVGGNNSETSITAGLPESFDADSTFKKVSGKIIDEKTGTPLAGVSVAVNGKPAGSTDGNGNFLVSATKDDLLQFSIIGYEPKDLKPLSAGPTTLAMITSAAILNDVVVVGYGTRSRKSLSTSISSISSKEITATPVADAAQALQGRVSGVSIVQNSGAPGGTGGTSIKIRGISSLTGTNNPLVVVDGYPLPDQGADNILNSFGTGDIESIDVLKDAAAASIYGVRASNGVIMITTKRGKAGKTNLNVDVYHGIQSAWQLPKMLNAREYAVINSEARIASGLNVIPKLADPNAVEQQYGEGTDWLDEVFRNAAITSANVTATGGSANAQYMLSAGYLKQDGILYKTDYERFNLRFNGDIKVNNRLKLGNSVMMSRSVEHGADTYTAFNSILILAMTAPPTVSPRNADGTYAGGNGSTDGFNEPNPIYQLEVPQNSFTKYRITGNVYAELEILKGLKFKALFGGDFNFNENRNFNPATFSTGGRPFVQSGYFTQKGLYPDYLTELTLTYDKTFKEKHKINAVAGYTFQENRYSYVFAGRGGDFRLLIPALNNQVFLPTDISQTYNGSEDGINSRLLSYFGRVNYDFDNRGFLALSIRRDGSSNFAPGNKFAIFPSVSAGWRLTRERFLENVRWLNELKVRGSFGYTGNPNVAANAYIQAINQSFQYTFGNSGGSGGVVAGAGPSRSYNPDIQWEKNEQVDIGFDAALFNNRLNITFDVYQRRSKDLILYVAPPFVSGTFESVPYNTGTLQNRGIDFSANGTIVRSKNFTWNASGVLGFYKNNVISLGLSAPLDGGFTRITGGSLRTIQGQPANFFYGFVTDGIFQSYDEIRKAPRQTPGTNPTTSTAPGDIRFKDLNNDGVIDDKDRTDIGNANPNFTYGLTNTISYKNIELTIFLQGSEGNRVLNFTRWYTEGGVSNGNYSKDVINRWNGPGSSNSMPRAILNDPNGNNRVSDRFVEDASYLRFKNVRLAWSLPTNWTNGMFMKRAQIYGSIQNLLTFTKYTGFDPEVGGGVDQGFYPQARTFIIGANIDF